MANFTRAQSSSLEQSTASLYNEAVKFRKAGLKEEAEDKFRAALTRNKKHVSCPTYSHCASAPPRDL